MFPLTLHAMLSYDLHVLYQQERGQTRFTRFPRIVCYPIPGVPASNTVMRATRNNELGLRTRRLSLPNKESKADMYICSHLGAKTQTIALETLQRMHTSCCAPHTPSPPWRQREHVNQHHLPPSSRRGRREHAGKKKQKE